MKAEINFLNYIEVPPQGNTDVEITYSGKVYAATFFTIDNIIELMDSYRTSGECCDGEYIWAADMILIRSIQKDSIHAAVQDLIENEELDKACTFIRESNQ